MHIYICTILVHMAHKSSEHVAGNCERSAGGSSNDSEAEMLESKQEQKVSIKLSVVTTYEAIYSCAQQCCFVYA